ncbi:MAG: DUF4392 domain-containing protein [Armatimonadetes bacterium]|nr:DUF4392 domain-containing protein [Armatimonadota bacterium]
MSLEVAYGQAIDALVSSAIRPKRAHAPTDMLHRLHAAGAAVVNEPMPLAAARHLVERVKKDDAVFLISGVYDPIGLPYGETDGPTGVASLARALDLGIAAKPVILCEEQVMEGFARAAAAAGLMALRDPAHWRQKAHSVLLLPFPITAPEASVPIAERMLDEHKPAAVVSIERIAGNAKQRHHYAVGTPITSEAYLEAVAEAANRRKIATVAVGDGGNEIGMGNILERVWELVPFGRKCVCDCGDGIACVTKADVLVVANTSNLGAYGIAAAMGILLRQPRLMHDRAMEQRMLEAIASAGCTDGGFISPSVDGTGDSSLAIVELLHKVTHFACA